MKLHLSIATLICAILAISSTEVKAAVLPTVDPGYDLFETTAGTNFSGNPLIGVPLGTYDFGSGSVSVGTTDTIVQRLAPAVGPNLSFPNTAPSVGLQMVALQLETASPINFGGFGIDNYFFTLQSVRGGPASTGSLVVNFDSLSGGTFASSLDVFFDIRKGSLVGPIVFSADSFLSITGAPWSRTPPAGAETINGVNFNLNTFNNGFDFWATPPLSETFAGFGAIDATVASVPEPASVSLLAVGGALLLWRRNRRTSRR